MRLLLGVTTNMMDFFHLPPRYKGDVQIFRANTAVDAQGMQTWNKPRGSSFCYMIAIGGGGGGGGGFTRVAGNAGGGGGGGASSCTAKIMIPAIFLPDQLFIQVGRGGLGGAANAAGGNGINSGIVFSPNAGSGGASNSTIIFANTNLPGGGGPGTGAAAGGAGAVPTLAIVTPFQATYGLSGTGPYQVGLVGLAGGVQTGAAGGNSVNGWANYLLTAGAGGAGCTTTEFSGGRQVVSGAPEFINFNIPANGDMIPQATAIGQNGGAGIQLWKPFAMSGGGGGASSNSGQAGNGGDGGIGCGGGGGGAGATGGRGGNGGDGIIIIISL